MTAHPITSVVFDLGGVLVDCNPDYLYRKLIPDEKERQHFRAHVCTRQWHHSHDLGVSFVDNAQLLLKNYPNDPRMQSLIKAWGTRYGEMFSGPIDKTVDILTELHKAGMPLYALTNWSADDFPVARKRFPFFSLFKDIVVSGIERVTKPDRKIYEILLERTKIDPHNAVFIDDREDNLTPAAALGFTTLLFTTPEKLRNDLINLNLPLA